MNQLSQKLNFLDESTSMVLYLLCPLMQAFWTENMDNAKVTLPLLHHYFYLEQCGKDQIHKTT